MKILYEKGDKVVVFDTGAEGTVTDVGPGGDVFVDGTGYKPEDLRPALDVAVLRGELSQIHRVFVAMRHVLLPEVTHDAFDLAKYYNQALDPEDESCFEVEWVETAAQLEAAIKNANGDTDEDEDEGLTCDECGQAMIMEEDGTSRHVDHDGNVDHEADAGHVAFNRKHDESGNAAEAPGRPDGKPGPDFIHVPITRPTVPAPVPPDAPPPPGFSEDLDFTFSINVPDEFPELWTEADGDAASAEGWDIFDASGSVDGRWQLQRIDCPDDGPEPRFAGDDAAAAFVKARAAEGSELHKRAVAFLVAVKSGDVKKFGLTGEGEP